MSVLEIDTYRLDRETESKYVICQFTVSVPSNGTEHGVKGQSQGRGVWRQHANDFQRALHGNSVLKFRLI